MNRVYARSYPCGSIHWWATMFASPATGSVRARMRISPTVGSNPGPSNHGTRVGAVR